MIKRTVLGSPQTLAPNWPERFRLPAQTLQAVLALLVTALLTFVLYLYVLPNSQMSEAESAILELKAQKAALTRKTAEIDRQIAGYTDLATLEARARKLGMGQPRSAIILPVESSQTQPLPQQATRADPGPAAEPQAGPIAWLNDAGWTSWLDSTRSWLQTAGRWLAARVGQAWTGVREQASLLPARDRAQGSR